MRSIAQILKELRETLGELRPQPVAVPVRVFG
jgi:hypothetical protein